MNESEKILLMQKKEGKWRNFDKSCLINAFLNEMGFGAETRMSGREFQTRMTPGRKKEMTSVVLIDWNIESEWMAP